MRRAVVRREQVWNEGVESFRLCYLPMLSCDFIDWGRL